MTRAPDAPGTMLAIYLALAAVGLLLVLEQWLRPAPGPSPGLRAVTLGLLFLGGLGAALAAAGRDPVTTLLLAAAGGLPTGLVAGLVLHRLVRPG